MKRLLFILSVLFAFQGLNAQQEAHFTQFMYNKLLINPAYAGARGVPSVTAIYRSQWAVSDKDGNGIFKSQRLVRNKTSAKRSNDGTIDCCITFSYES